MQTRARTIDTARRREVAARRQIDPRTLDKAIAKGLDAIRRGMARDRARAALEDLGLHEPKTA